MKIVRGKDLEYIPSSHEDIKDPGVWKKVLFKKDEVEKGRVQMVNWSRLPIGKSFKLHYHEDMDEIFIMMSGTALVKVDNEEATLENGDAVVIPQQKSHKMTNIGNEDVLYLVIGVSREKNGKTIIVE